MTTIVLVIHLIIALALVGVILIQRSEGGGLGMGGGNFGGLMSGRGAANFLTRTTAILATSFMATSILLAILAGASSSSGSIADRIEAAPPPEPEGPIAPLAD